MPPDVSRIYAQLSFIYTSIGELEAFFSSLHVDSWSESDRSEPRRIEAKEDVHR